MPRRRFTAVSAGIAIATAAVWSGQWLESATLRADVKRARVGAEELGRLKAENLRLRGQQVSESELERLRGDREALTRLRAELVALKTEQGRDVKRGIVERK